MILIDDKKTIIAGEALKVMAELGMVVDRLLLELADKDRVGLTYEELVDRFQSMILNIKKVRGNREDVTPQDIFENTALKELFPEDFFQTFAARNDSGGLGRRDGSSTSRSESNTSASDLLKEAMEKLNRTKAAAASKEEPKKKKKKKNKKKD